VVIPLAMRMSVTSNGEQRVQVLIPVVQGLSQKQRQLMQQYFELVDWQGLKLPSAERRQRDSLKCFERSVEVWKDWISLKKELATLGDDDGCFYYHSWRNNVVITFGALSSFLT